ncbi:MAG TPA: hypothetical protein VFN95_18705, partial [Flavitalea sp.]|nr:hypothetical protein [Flavitalea sp.]
VTDWAGGGAIVGRLFNISINEPLVGNKAFMAWKEKKKSIVIDLQKAEAQARESQIQLAMERVRARTMAMQKSDELPQAANLLFQQVQSLGMPAWSAGYCTWNNDKKTSITLSMSSEGVLQPTLSMPLTKDPSLMHFREAWERGESFFVEEVGGEELKTHYTYLRTLPGVRETLDQIEAAGFPVPTFQIFHLAYFSKGFLLFITYEPVPEAHDIFKRFAKVFEQTYTRFLDLQKAEAQSREAQIELGLERVRARAMAMQNSDELKELIGTVFIELTKLDLVLTRCLIVIFDPKTNGSTWWMANSEAPSDPIGLYVKYHDHPPYLSYVKGWQERNLKWQYILEGKDKKEWDDFLFVETELSHLPDFVIAGMKAPGRVYLNASFNSFGNLTLASLEPLSNEHFDILLRFAKVFDLTYTRFNDLKQAEAQARESHIQLALERVRARTMAMQKSDELREVVATLYEQLNQLNFDSNACNIIIIDKETNNQQYWVSGFKQKLYPESYDVPYFEHPYLDVQLQSWRQGQKYTVIEYSGKTKKEFDKQFFSLTEFKNIPQEVQKIIKALESAMVSTAFFAYGALQSIGPDALNDENAEILRRFASVFDQTYTRFLDLQTAEAQGREAQIQLALERVRARTMAMQKSEELSETSFVLFQQFRELGSTASQMSIGIIHENEDFMEMSATIDGNQLDYVINVSLDEPVVMKKLTAAWKERKRSLVIDIYGDELRKYNEYRNSIGGKFKFETKERDHWVVHIAFFSKGMLSFSSHERHPDETVELLERFAAVFDLTYTRFLDLKNAEAQARESQIQLALERVRARTMAMQHSEELAETATVLFEQFNNLGELPERIAIGIINEEEHVFDIWATQHGGTQMNLLLKLSLDEPHVMKKMYQAWKDQSKFITIDLQGNELEEYFQFLRRSGASVQREIFGDRRVENVATFSKGVLMIITKEPRHAEVNKILERFAGVFDQTYTRFLDLQKAEAQAREAQIEAALEKVRARTMGMQKSDELAEVVGLLFKQFEQLDFGLYQLLISIYDTRNNIIEWWSKGFGDVALPQRNIIPIIDHPFPNILLEKWKSGTEYYAHTLEGDLKNSWEDYLFTQTDLKYFPQEVKDAMKSLDKVYLSDVFIKYGSIQAAGPMPLPDDKASVLKRFAKVLDLAYTRMTDLQNAEAQAKEAKIEAALERVRSRSLAMHSPEELKGVALELRNQLGLLEQPELEVCAIQLYEESPDYFEAWGAVRPPGDEGKIIQVQVQFPKKGIKIVDEMFQQYESGAQDYVLLNEGEKVPEWLNVLKERVPEGYEMVIQSLQGRRPEDTRAYWSMADFKGGSLVMTTYIPPSDDARKLLRRFANVFGLAYRRFIDLKNAEIQKREAQIELALERVRARTMAMHRSEELAETAQVLFQQLRELGSIPERISIGLVDEAAGVVNFWTTDQLGSHIDKSFKARLDERTVISKTYQAWKENKRSLVVDLHGDEVKEWIQFAREEMGIVVKGEFIKDRRAHNLAFFSHGWILVTSHEPLSAETIQILERFASVFNLTYRRFLDLEKAEAQARESELELALERVRAKSMSMRHSDELAELVKIVFKELTRIGFSVNACIIMTYDEGTNDSTWWISNFDGVSNPVGLFVPNHSNEPYLAYL